MKTLNYIFILALALIKINVAYSAITVNAKEATNVLDNEILTHEEKKKVSTPARKESKTNSGLFRRMFSDREDLTPHPEDNDDPGEPAFLTPLLEAGKIADARKLAQVRIGHRYGHSFAGFLTVNKNYNSNLYFWFFPSSIRDMDAPLLVWLQGGPGGSSLFGLFTENGPFSVNDDLNLVHRNYSWTKNHSVIFIDNPVGTGFSFTENENGYAKDESDVGQDLYEFMRQFYKLFPELLKNSLYITGESYAGKYVPALAYTIHKENPEAAVKMPLKGIAIGDGLCDPVSMTDYGDFLFQIGLVDDIQRNVISQEANKAVQFIKAKEWVKAFQVFDGLLNGDMTKGGSLFYNMTGLTDYYNFLQVGDAPADLANWEKFVNRNRNRKEINVGNLTFHNGVKVETMLMSDVMQSVKPWIEELMNHYKVMLYNGQLDIIIAYALTDQFISTLNWQYATEFKKSPRHIWRVDGDIAGYVRQVPGFAQVLVRNAGHLVPYDQPKWAADMIGKFVAE